MLHSLCAVIILQFPYLLYSQILSGASWPALGGGNSRSGGGQASGPTDSSVEKKWTYTLGSDGGVNGPSPVVDDNGNIFFVTAGGSVRSMSTTAATNPSPLFSGALTHDTSVSAAGGAQTNTFLGQCTPIPLTSTLVTNPTSGVFTYINTNSPPQIAYVPNQAVYVASLGSCANPTTGTLSTSKIYYLMWLTSTTFSLSESLSTVTAISLTCSGATPPTLVSALPGAKLTLPYPGAILAVDTLVVASLPCMPSPCTNTALTASILADTSTSLLTPTITGINTNRFTLSSTAIASLSATAGSLTQFIFTSLGSCTVGSGQPALSLTTVYYVTAKDTGTLSFTFTTSTGTLVSPAACTTFPTVAVYSTSYTVSPTTSSSTLTATSVTAGVLNFAANPGMVGGQPFIFTSIAAACTGAPSLGTVYYAGSSATAQAPVPVGTTTLVFSATQFGTQLTTMGGGAACTAAIQPYTQSTGCLLSASSAVASGTNAPSISFTSSAPPSQNWYASLANNAGGTAGVYSLKGVAQSSVLGLTQPLTATPALDNSGVLWLPMGSNLLPIKSSSGILGTATQTGVFSSSCSPTTTPGSFMASISGTALTISAGTSPYVGSFLTATLASSDYIFTGVLNALGQLTVSSTFTPYLPIGCYLSTPSSPSTVFTVLGLQGSSTYVLSSSPALSAGVGSTSIPATFTVTLPPGLMLSASGLKTGTTIVSGSGLSYVVSVSQTLAATTFTSTTGLPTSPVIDANNVVAYTCGYSIVYLPPNTNNPTTQPWNTASTYGVGAALSTLTYSSASGKFYAGDSVGRVFAWTNPAGVYTNWFTTATLTWSYPPAVWPTGVLARDSGLNAALFAPVVGASYAGVEQVYATACTPSAGCTVNALSGTGGADNWLYGNAGTGYLSGFPLSTCYPTALSAVGADKVAIVCGTSGGSYSATLYIITNTASSGLTHRPISGFKFSSAPIVDASGSALYFAGRDGCVTGYSLASFTSTWQMPSGCASSTTLASFGATQPALTGGVTTALTSSTGSSGTPGFIVAIDSGLSVTAYGRYGSASASGTATASTSISHSASPSLKPSPSPSPALSPSALPGTPTVTVSGSITATQSPTLSLSLSTTTTASASLSPTVSPTPSLVGSPTSAATPSPSQSPSLSTSATPSLSLSPSLKSTSTTTMSVSDSTSSTPLATMSFSLPATPTAAASLSATITASPSPTQTPTNTPSNTPSFTPWGKALDALAAAKAAESSPSASLTDAGIAMVVIGTLALFGAIGYTLWKHPEFVEKMKEACFGGEVRGGSGGGGAGGSGGGGGGSSGGGGPKGTPGYSGTSGSGSTTTSSKFRSSGTGLGATGSSSTPNPLGQSSGAPPSSSSSSYSSAVRAGSGSGAAPYSPYASTYGAEELGASAAGSAAGASMGSSSRSLSRGSSSSKRSGAAAAAAEESEEGVASLTVRSTSSSRRARVDEAGLEEGGGAGEEEEAAPRRSASVGRRGSFSVRKSSSKKPNIYDDWTTRED
jgi:hypothetical protein